MSLTPPAAGANLAGWTSNASLPELAGWLRTCRSVVVLTHSKPDGDAIGATLALARALAMLPAGAAGGAADERKSVMVLYSGPLPVWLDAVAGDTPRMVVEAATGVRVPEPDGIVVLDTGSWAQLEEVRPWLETRTARTAVIDHHLQGDGSSGSRRHIDTAAAAACEPCAELCRILLGVPRVADLPVPVAEALYLGLTADTGWFRHSNTSARVLRLGAALLEAGVDHPGLFERVEQSDRAARLRLIGRAIASMELVHEERVAILSLRLKDFQECRGAPGDSGGFAELPLSIASVRVGVMLTEVDAGARGMLTKVSMRSKARGDSVDVNRICQRLGGGGHAHAAGARVALPLEQARRLVIEALA